MNGTAPDFRIDRLGPATISSPLGSACPKGGRFFVGDDQRKLYDSVGQGWHHGQMLTQIDAANLELAGPREFLYFAPAATTAAIVTCGGLCPGINNVIRGLTLILRLQYGIKRVLGIRYGYAGLVPGGPPPLELTPEVVEPIHERGGTFLGSSRGEQPIPRMLEFLQREQVQILFTIGGDGTQRGALALANAARAAGYPLAIIGLPKTIDNDINYVDRTFGFETAFSVAQEALKAAHAEALGAMNGICIVKLMGRNSGYLTTQAALANGDVNFALIPEVPFQLAGRRGLLAALTERMQRRGHAVIAVAEGAGQDLLREEAERLGHDASGNPRLADIGLALKTAIEQHGKPLGWNVRYIDPSYMVRSAPAVATDAVFCLRLAHHAAHAAMSGRTGMLVGIWEGAFIHVPLTAIAHGKKHLDPEGPLWLSLLQATGQPARLLDD